MAVTPTTASSGSRGLRIQGMPVRRWLRTTPGRLPRGLGRCSSSGCSSSPSSPPPRPRPAATPPARSNANRLPRCVAAQSLYASLADADATASTIFLRAGLEPQQLRDRFRRDLRRRRRRRRHPRPVRRHLGGSVGRTLRAGSPRSCPRTAATSSRRVPTSPRATRSGARISRPAYDDDARRDPPGDDPPVPRRGRAARGQLRVGHVDAHARRRAGRRPRHAGAARRRAGLRAPALEPHPQLRARGCDRARRRALRMDAPPVRGRPRRARSVRRSQGSDSVEVLSSARILTLRAQNNENLALIARGNGDAYVAEFDRVMKALGGTDGTGGLLGYAAELGDRTGDGRAHRRARASTSPPSATCTRQVREPRRRRELQRGRLHLGRDGGRHAPRAARRQVGQARA